MASLASFVTPRPHTRRTTREHARAGTRCTTHRAGRAATYAAWAGLALLLMNAPSWAGQGTQGTTVQGTTVQGSTWTGAEATWLQGAQLVASLADGTVIEILRFAGDTVHAVRQDPLTGQEELVLLQAQELAGMQWTESSCDHGACTYVRYRVAEVAPDTSTNTMPRASDNSDIWLYRVEYSLGSEPANPDNRWASACEPTDTHGDMGLFVDGRWRADGAWQPDGYTFSCPRGVIAKCARAWGYKPWETLQSPVHGAVDLQPLHLACTRAARAEYCGDGVAHTRDSTLIDLFDVYGFNVREPDTGFIREALFDENGAVQFHHPRVPGLMVEGRGVPGRSRCRSEQAGRPETEPLIHVWSDPAYWLRRGPGASLPSS